MIWTDAQQNAIDARNSNILVSAAAGSGKTAVLVERVVKLITDEVNPVPLDKLLIVTFTNAAAAEMKNKISRALSDRINNNQNDSNAIYQMSLLPNARISTTDAFCMNLVRENFFKLNISQDFNILDDGEAVLIEQNAVDAVLNEMYEQDSVEFKTLVEMLSSTNNDNALVSSIKRLHNYIMAQPFPFDWLDKMCELYNPEIPFDNSRIKDYALEEIAKALEGILEIIQSSKDMLTPDIDNYDKVLEVVESDKAIFEHLYDNLNKISWNDLKRRFENLSFMTMTRAKCPVKSIISDNRVLYKGSGSTKKGILQNEILPFFDATSEEFATDNQVIYPSIKLLCSIVKEYHNKLRERKDELNAYSFADIEHFAIDLLFHLENGEIVKTELAKDFESNFYEILVDEYQDTNSAQDKLYTMLSNGKNLFMVGDVKQSIYRFRLAMPQIFNAKKDSYTPYNSESYDINRKIIFDRNFRSRKGICDYTNFVFSNIMTRYVGELDYNKEEYLNYGAKYDDSKTPAAQIKLINTPAGENADEYEAKQVAKLILDKIASGELIEDGEDYRSIRYSDICVLFRSASGRMPIFAKVFNEYSIPVVSNNKTNLFDNNEVAILMSLIRAIDNPTLDIPLMATLMSVFYGYTADDLANARVNHPARNLYSSIVDDERFANFVDNLNKYRKYSASMSVESFLRQIIGETSYLSVISSMGNAEQRQQNVMKLLEIARRFDSGSNIGLTAFVRYVDNIIELKLNVDSASVTHIGEDSVELMTIHNSKGLEFPVCILVGAGHKYNNDDLNNLVQLNDDLGIGLKVHNEQGLYRYNSMQYVAIHNQNTRASMSENLRVLYVAITRAKEQFITVVSDKNIESHVNGLSKKIINNKIPPMLAKRVQKDGDFILLTALLHKDGGVLRDFCDADICADPTATFDMSVDFISDSQLEEAREIELAQSNPELVDNIREKLSYSYDNAELSGFASKRTASSLDERETDFTYFASSKPAFLQESGMTSAQRGTAMHAFMQYCSYEYAKADIECEIMRLVDMSYITKEQADSLDRKKLSNLFNSEFGNRIFSSDNVYREIKVSSYVPVSDVEDTNLNDLVYIQGIADCVFEENGELVLVDYKTDRVDNEQELLDRYKKQLAFYKNAVSKVLQKPVKESMLYSFWLDKCCIYK